MLVTYQTALARVYAKGKALLLVVLTLLTWLVAPNLALALSKDDDIDTNRPSFMDSPLVVPKGSLQVENGTLYQHFQHGVNYYDLSETELRLGITQRTEFQMFVPQWVMFYTQPSSINSPSFTDAGANVLSTSSSTFQNGVSDITEPGIKHQFGPFFKDLNVSFIGGVTVPTGRRLISRIRRSACFAYAVEQGRHQELVDHGHAIFACR